jgi:Family of unknown function (DUF6527)
MIFSVKRWWKHFHRGKKIGRVVVVDSMTSVPEEIGGDLYLVRRDGHDKRVVLNCPCSCGRRIDLSLVASERPHWTIKMNKNKFSLYPSVWLTSDPCQSHFVIRDNKIKWFGE